MVFKLQTIEKEEEEIKFTVHTSTINYPYYNERSLNMNLISDFYKSYNVEKILYVIAMEKKVRDVLCHNNNNTKIKYTNIFTAIIIIIIEY